MRAKLTIAVLNRSYKTVIPVGARHAREIHNRGHGPLLLRHLTSGNENDIFIYRFNLRISDCRRMLVGGGGHEQGAGPPPGPEFGQNLHRKARSQFKENQSSTGRPRLVVPSLVFDPGREAAGIGKQDQGR